MASENNFLTLSESYHNKNENFDEHDGSEASGDDNINDEANELKKVFIKGTTHKKENESIFLSDSEDENSKLQEMPEWSDIYHDDDDDNVNTEETIEIETSGDDDDTEVNSHNKLHMKKRFSKQKNFNKKDRENISSSSSGDDEDTISLEMSAKFNAEWKYLNQTDDNSNNNMIDATTKNIKSLDLLNDVIVNDIAANQLDISLNPDAEYIDNNHMMSEKYDKLMLNDETLK